MSVERLGVALAGGSNAAPFKIQASAETTASDFDQADSSFSMTVPMWVNLAGFGVAIFIVIFAIKYARKSSAAIDTAIGVADSGMSSVIRAIRLKNADDPVIALLEAERGKVAAKKPVR